MKKTILATVLTATFLAGCSSNSSKSPDGVADVIINEELRSAAIIGDEGNNATVIGDGNGNALVSINGNLYVVQGDIILNAEGEAIGTVITENGTATVYINGNSYAASVSDGRLIVDTPIIDNDWGVAGAPTYADIVTVNGTVLIQGDNDNFVAIKADQQGNALITINGGESTFVVKDGEVFNYESNESVGHIQKDGDNYTLRLDNGTEVVFRNDDGRLFAGVISGPDIGIDIPGLVFTPVEDNQLIISLGQESVTLTDTAAGVIISGPEGTTTVSIKTINAYKEASELLNPTEQKALALMLIANEGRGAVDEAFRVAVWNKSKEETKGWAKDNKVTMLKIAAIEMDLQGNSLGYYLLTGKKETVENVRAAVSDAINDWAPGRVESINEIKMKAKSLSIEQRQQIKQSIKSRLQARS